MSADQSLKQEDGILHCGLLARRYWKFHCWLFKSMSK